MRKGQRTRGKASRRCSERKKESGGEEARTKGK